MRERGLLFSAPMVLALRDEIKTQTRRLVNPRVYIEEYASDMPGSIVVGVTHQSSPEFAEKAMEWLPCPYGVVGDRLWVRETWASAVAPVVAYRADGECGAWMGDGDGGGGRIWCRHGGVVGPEWNRPYTWRGDSYGLGKFGGRWRPSIHMPRWASRFTLEITDIRIERVQSISLADVLAEGVRPLVSEDRRPLVRLTGPYPVANYLSKGFMQLPFTEAAEAEWARAHYASLWDSLNEKRGAPWCANPWVWVITFKRIES